MAKRVASFRLEAGVLDWVGSYAKTRGSSQAVVVEEALRHFRLLSESGVPDLPVVDTPEVRVQRAEEAAGGLVKPAREYVAPAFADARGSRQQRLNAASLRARSARGK